MGNPTWPGLAAKRPVRERRDLHNTSVEQSAAAACLCGMLDLRTGRVCVLPVHHRGSCQFVSHDELSTYLAGLQSQVT